jgi:hypothetical protein
MARKPINFNDYAFDASKLTASAALGVAVGAIASYVFETYPHLRNLKSRMQVEFERERDPILFAVREEMKQEAERG